MKVQKWQNGLIFCETRLLMSVEVYNEKNEPPACSTDRDRHVDIAREQSLGF
jgi:hypothetical protein